MQPCMHKTPGSVSLFGNEIVEIMIGGFLILKHPKCSESHLDILSIRKGCMLEHLRFLMFRVEILI